MPQLIMPEGMLHVRFDWRIVDKKTGILVFLDRFQVLFFFQEPAQPICIKLFVDFF